MQRRSFLHHTTRAALGLSILGLSACGGAGGADDPSQPPLAQSTAAPAAAPDKWFRISLAQWSLNEALFGGELDHLDFARKARDFDLGGIEYVNQFFKDKATDMAYLKQMNERAADHGVEQLLIMIDGEGNLGATDAGERAKAVENHYKWVDAAQYLGCHSIRVNAAGEGTRAAVAAAATDGLRSLATYAAQADLNVLVENHGGYSSDGAWLASVIAGTEMENCGTLPDFGNFCVERNNPERRADGCKTEYDRYKGVTELMPYAKAVSAKTYNFNDRGVETDIDYARMMRIVKDAGYRGWVGIEYEGTELAADTGITLTRDLLRRVREEA